MKKTSLVRKIDELGRFVLPKDIRKKLGVNEGDFLELYINEDLVHLKRYSCIQNLEVVATILIDAIYDIYGIESVLMEADNIIAGGRHNKEKILSSIKKEKYIASSISYEGKDIGRLILFSINEEAEKLLNMATLFLRKYLEE